MMTVEQWDEYSALKNIEFRAIEYSTNDRMINYNKFISYLKRDNVDISFLFKKYGEEKSKKIIMSILKGVIKREQN